MRVHSAEINDKTALHLPDSSGRSRHGKHPETSVFLAFCCIKQAGKEGWPAREAIV